MPTAPLLTPLLARMMEHTHAPAPLLLAVLSDLLARVLRLLTVHLGPVGLSEALFTLPGLWATWRLWGPLRAAGRDLMAARALSTHRGSPEELIARERLAILRFFAAIVVWIDLTGLMYMMQPQTAHTDAERTLSLVSTLVLVAGLLGLAVGVAVLATRLDRWGPRIIAAMRAERADDEMPWDVPLPEGE